MIFLPASGHVATPWKNGGGTTREIAAFPADAGLDAFDWRVSIAEVASDGPFSPFPGIDRTLTLLTGDGILLRVDGTETRLIPGSAPFAFAGDKPAGATLLGGPVTDLNVMTRRGRITHRVTAIRESRVIAADLGVLVWIAGSGGIDGQAMGPLDALRAEKPAEWTIAGKDFLAYWAEFTPVT